MKRIWLLAVVLLAFCAPAQDDTMTLDDVMQSAQQWAEENLDDNVLRALKSTDQEKVRQFLEDIRKEYQGQYVIDIASLRDTAKTIIPLLESSEDTAPYAAWLKAQLDYLDVAEQFRRIIPPPKVVPGQPPKRPPNPTAQQEREVWITKLAKRPWPEAATPYVKRLKPIFAAQKVPAELVWIAEVESSFNPSAHSPAGAAGLFQLMPVTAKQYGLRRWPFDQRLDPEKSATAAAQYLERLHSRFSDWRLTLAAYNAGEGTVRRLMEKHKATTFDAISTYLPAETQMYVPRIEATLLRREGCKLTELRRPVVTATRQAQP
jgi:membrane-bound lytic murein transglycosylase D